MSDEVPAGWRPNTRWPVLGVLDFDDDQVPPWVEVRCALPSPPADFEISVPGGLLPSLVGRTGQVRFGGEESYLVRVVDEHTLRLMVGPSTGPAQAE